jgi:hypothetical protein
MGIEQRYPERHAEFLKRCHDHGQTRSTPLSLQYVPGDFNCLHQDIYGELAFPLQIAILLSEPKSDFTGGEFVLTEQRPRMQSRVEVVPLRKGDAVAFAVGQGDEGQLSRQSPARRKTLVAREGEATRVWRRWASARVTPPLGENTLGRRSDWFLRVLPGY